MEAKNLRIGNFVKVNNQEYHPELADEMLVVIGINQTDNLEKNGRTHSISMNHLDNKKNYVIPAISQFEMFVQGIELSDKWLTDFGFMEKKDCEGWHKEDVVFYKGFICDVQRHKIEYVHELQNLFFAITGTELELKDECSNCG